MNWLIISIISFGLIGYILYLGKTNFWKLIGKNPEEAYKYFINHPDVWKIINSENSDSEVVDKREWSGPYRLYVPSVGVIKFYGKEDVLEAEQNRLALLLKHKDMGLLNN